MYLLLWAVMNLRQTNTLNMKKLVIVSAPSGAGKSTLIKALMQQYPNLALSISACTRSPRIGETPNVSYYFLSVEDFKNKIDNDEFIEWEMVYEGKYYGTLYTELERIWAAGQIPILDIDVVGAINLMKKYQGAYISIFIKAPSIEVLKSRLVKRGTETEAALQERVQKASFENTFQDKFQHVVVNDELDRAVSQISQIVKDYLQ